jgi:hypothetical protein
MKRILMLLIVFGSYVEAQQMIFVPQKKRPVGAYNIVVTEGANGATTPSGTTSVAAGGSQAFTFAGNSGYEVDSVFIDGVYDSTATWGSYTFTNVTAAHTIRTRYVATIIDYSPAVVNGGFESGYPTTTWTFSAEGSGVSAVDSTNQYAGGYGLKLYNDVSGHEAICYKAAFITNGKTYRFKLYAKAAAGTTATFNVYFRLTAVPLTITDSYVLYQGQAIGSASGDKFNLRLAPTSSKTIYIDNVRVWQIN